MEIATVNAEATTKPLLGQGYNTHTHHTTPHHTTHTHTHHTTHTHTHTPY